MSKLINVVLRLLHLQFGLIGSIVIDDTTVRGEIKDVAAIEVLEDTVFTTLRMEGMTDTTGVPSTYYDGKTVLAGTIIYGWATHVTLTSGAIRLHSDNKLSNPSWT